MTKLSSLSLFVGTGDCNAYCKHCAGVPLRKYAPKKDGVIDEQLIKQTIEKCYTDGARYLSLSSSGEPTLSPNSLTKVFDILQKYKERGIEFSPINLYSNGIRIGFDKEFSEQYLQNWQEKGLTTIYVTIHGTTPEKNAKIYNIEKYPEISDIVTNIHEANLSMRANIVLSNNNIGTYNDFKTLVNYLFEKNVDTISAWPLRTLDDKIDAKKSPLESELDKIEEWKNSNENLNKRVRLLRENSKIDYTSGEKLTLFPNGVLSNTWCN